MIPDALCTSSDAQSGEMTFCAADCTDENWVNGFARGWGAAFFVQNTDKARDELVFGRKLLFANGSTRIITRTEANGGALMVYYSGDGDFLDGAIVGHPHTIALGPLLEDEAISEERSLERVLYTPYDFTDGSFVNGVARSGSPAFIVANIGNAKRILKPHRVVSFAEGSTRTIIRTEDRGHLLYVFCGGGAIDSSLIGYPHKFTVSDACAREPDSTAAGAADSPVDSADNQARRIDTTVRGNIFCIEPFKNFDIQLNGDVFFCCPIFTSFHKLGNIFTDKVEDIWNGERAKRFRFSVCKGKLEFCNHYCFWLSSALRGDTLSTNSVLESESTFRRG